MWKVADFQDLPDWVEEKKQAAEVKETTVSFQSQGQDFKIYYQTASPVSEEKGLTVLLLHGMRFSSQTWTDIGTLHVLAALGHSAIAIDLPGYAKSKDQKPLDDTACFLTDVIAALKLDRPVLVSPSLSGSYTLPFLLGTQPEIAAEKCRGYVPVAPIYTDQFEEVYKKCQVPTLIVQGSKDIPMGSTASQHLSALPNSYLHIMEGGGHPCYLDNPKEWHCLLYNFLEALTK